MRFTSKGALRASLGAGVLACGLLASCGGGTQVEKFTPTRVLSLGDETSALDDSGSPGNARKFSINAVVSATDPTLVCVSNPIWVQVLANSYGMVFAQCNPDGLVAKAVNYSVPGAKVANIAAQAAQLGPLSGFELVTVLAGANDILEQYARYPGVSEAQLTAELEATGAVLADQVNAIANAGGKVLISTVPDLGLTPFAIAQRDDPANADTDRAALLSRLTGRFNAKLRANIINDGRRIGLLLADEIVQTVVKYPSTYGYVNVVAPACLSTAPLPTCTTVTLQPASGNVLAAGSHSWLWSDATHLSPGGHNQLGALAATRAAGNPF